MLSGGRGVGREVARMLAKVLTGAAVGLECSVVEVEVDLANGLPNFTRIGTRHQSSPRCHLGG